MSNRREGWWWDRDKLQAALDQHESLAAVARATAVPATTLKHAADALGVTRGKAQQKEEARVTIDGDEATVVTEAGRTISPKDVEALVQERGISLDEWVVERIVVNEWDGFTKLDDGTVAAVPLRQLKVTLKRRIPAELILPAVHTDVPVVKRPAQPKSSPELWFLTGDDQEPWGDPVLRHLITEWVATNTPPQAIHLGDLMDLGPLSRHRPNPVWDASVQDGVNAGYARLRAYRDASPGTEWRMLPCNHGERLRDYQLAHAAHLYGVRPADVDGVQLPAALSIPGLLHLEKLGIEYLGNSGDYEHVEADIVPNYLVARHGFVTGANSAAKTADRLGKNVITGHTHRQRIHWVTESRFGKTLTFQAVEAGCTCRLEGGLGYVVEPDWQQGFATATVWPDGSHVIEHASYTDGVLRWRDQRFEPRLRAVA